MGMRETFQIIIDVATENSQKSLKGLRSEVSKTEGGFNKLKAAGSGSMDYLKDHAAAFAIGAGTALVGFAAKSIAAFEELGLEVEKLTTATGLSAEAASRLIEVAGDVGVSSETLADGIGKMEKTLGANADAFKDLGIQTRYAKDGTVDANATFLAAVDALNKIKDPTEKAAAGAAIFGKGWAAMSELIAQGGPQLEANLAAVDEAKIFDDKKVQDAKNLREAFDNIADAGENVALQVGGALAPAMVNASKSVVNFIEKVEAAEAKTHFLSTAIKVLGGNADNMVGNLPENFNDLIPRIEAAGLSVADWNEKLILGKADSVDLTNALVAAEKALGIISPATDEQTKAQKDANAATQAAADALDEKRLAEEKAMKAAENARLEALRNIDADFNYRASIQDTKDALEDYIKTTNDHSLSKEEQQIATDEMVTKMAAEASAYAASKGLAEGSKGAIDAMITSLYIQAAAAAPGSALQTGLSEYILKLQAINAGLTPEALKLFNMQSFNGKAVNMHMQPEQPKSTKGVGATGVGATGGIVTRPTNALIGEAGPEMVIPLSSMPGASPLPSMSGSGSTINLTVNAGLGTDGAAVGQQIVNMLKQYQRTNGPFDFTSR